MSSIQIIHGRRIVTETYYDGIITRTSEQIEPSMFTDKQTMLKDVIDALAVITSGQTKKLEIEISLDNKGRYLLTKRWVI
jgi:capsid portal protein